MPSLGKNSGNYYLSRQRVTPCQLSQRRRHQHVQIFHHPALTQLTWSLTLCWLTRRGVSLRIDSLDVESHLALTQLLGNETLHQLSHRWKLKNLNKSANSRTKSKTLKRLIIWPIYVWSVQKTRTKSRAILPLNPKVDNSGYISSCSNFYQQYLF